MRWPILALLSLSLWLPTAQAQVESVKSYLIERVTQQKAATAQLAEAARRYEAIVRNAGFKYASLAQQHGPAIRNALRDARMAWIKASPIYESVEGIVAGVELLSDFDLNLDAGTSGAEGGDAVVTFDLKLANGKVLPRPGNLFGVLEGSLWGSERAFSSGVAFDMDGDGRIGFGDQLPDALILQAAAEKLDAMTGELLATARTWKPTTQDVFRALAANVPTAASVFIERWKTSRFVLGDKATRRDFNVISSLEDLINNITSWQQLYGGVAQLVQSKNPSLDRQIRDGLASLKTWVQHLAVQEKTRRFTPEQAEMILKEGDNRATAVTGKIVQAAALLGIKVE